MTLSHSVAIQIHIADERLLAGSGPVDDDMLVHAITRRMLQAAADCPADRLEGYYKGLGLRLANHPVEAAAIARAQEIIGQVMDDIEDAGHPMPAADKEGEIA